MRSRTTSISAVAAAAALAATLPAAGAASDLRIRVEGVRSARGAILVAVCSAETFLQRRCQYAASAEASPGTSEVTVHDVAPGTYAVQAIHDENDNRDLDRSFFGIPKEGMGFSRDAPMRLGPPRFSDAAVEIGESGGTVAFSMRYF